MGSVLRLQVHLRIPVGVKENYGICRLKVESQPTSSGTEQKYVVLRIFLVEHLHALTPFLSFGAAVEAEVFDAFVVEVDLHNVHEVGHLGEYQQSVVELLQFGENSINELEFS